MSKYSKDEYTNMFDQLLSQELCYNSSAATEENIKSSMKRVLGCAIKHGLLKNYAGLDLDGDLNVHFTITDADNSVMDITLYYNNNEGPQI